MDIRLVILTTAFLTTMVVACSKENDRRADAPIRTQARDEGVSQETRSAAASLTQSRCSREQRCENVGEGKKYSSFADCEATIGNEWREDINARECSTGVNDAQLDECLTEIRNEDCSSPFDSLERVAACTQSQICNDE